MERSQTYHGGLTAEQFLFPEIRICARLALEGKDIGAALAAIREENLFQYPTEREVSRMAKACYKRLEALDSEALIRDLAHGPTGDAKQINLYAIMRQNALVWDFMTRIIGEKLRYQDMSFSQRDLNGFFAELQGRGEPVSAWSEATVRKIKSVLVKMLVETEYLDNAKSTTLNPILLCEELEAGIRVNGDQEALPAFCCFG